MRLIKFFLFILPSVFAPGVSAAITQKSTVLVCYGRLDPEIIKGYNYVILEPLHYNVYEIKKIKSQNKKVLSYISIGEVNANAPHYSKVKGDTFGKNEIWNSYYLNLESAKTRKVLMDLITAGIEKGYDGFFLDNIDNFTHFGPQPTQKDQMVSFLKEIYTKYPDHTFLQNAGLELIDDTAPYVDAVIIESIATNYTFDDKTYKLRSEIDFNNYITKLKAIKDTYGLPIILIEYADRKSLVDEVLKRVRPLKFEYFIGKIDLQGVPEFKVD